MGTEERACGNFKGQLKKKWKFYLGVLVFDLGTFHTQLCRFSWGKLKSFFCPGFLRVIKVKYLKIPGGMGVGGGGQVQKSMSSIPSPPPAWIFSGIVK